MSGGQIQVSKVDDKLKELGFEPEGGGESALAGIEDVEERIGATLPEGYRRFLKTYGGGMFSEDVYYREHDRAVLFGWLFEADEILDAIESFSEVLPESMVPIGDDGGGNLYCLGFTGSDENNVYFHDHSAGWQADAQSYEERGEEVPADIRYQTVYRIADSFEEFIESMSKE